MPKLKDLLEPGITKEFCTDEIARLDSLITKEKGNERRNMYRKIKASYETAIDYLDAVEDLGHDDLPDVLGANLTGDIDNDIAEIKAHGNRMKVKAKEIKDKRPK